MRKHRVQLWSWSMLAILAPLGIYAQEPVRLNPLREPGWNYGVQASGGVTALGVKRGDLANHPISSLALAVHVGDVLTHENKRGLVRGTLEWDFDITPLNVFWVYGPHYAGGFDTGPRWNFTHNTRRMVPFVALLGGLAFSPKDFPPGDTHQTNFTAAAETGTHLFVRPRRSIEFGARVYHLSNAYLGNFNPGVPVSLQLVVGYTWY